jgi:hypothetical protein
VHDLNPVHFDIFVLQVMQAIAARFRIADRLTSVIICIEAKTNVFDGVESFPHIKTIKRRRTYQNSFCSGQWLDFFTC